VRRFLTAWVVVVACLVAVPARAAVTAKVSWGEVFVREGADAARLTKELNKLLKAATKRADWGKRKDSKESYSLSARVTKLEWQESGGIVHLEVAAVGKVSGGAGVKTKIRVGGKPTERKKLEKEGLRIVAEGLVTRLADVVRRKK
jgi:hypothetical protein